MRHVIAYKKVTMDFKEFILTLSVPEHAQRKYNPETRQWRVSEATVLSAENMDGRPTGRQVFCSMFDWNFIYRVGQTAFSPVDEKRTGIHCYSTKIEALSYMGVPHGSRESALGCGRGDSSPDRRDCGLWHRELEV